MDDLLEALANLRAALSHLDAVIEREGNHGLPLPLDTLTELSDELHALDLLLLWLLNRVDLDVLIGVDSSRPGGPHRA